MSVFARKVVAVAFAVAAVGVLIALYVADWATSFPTPVSSTLNPASAGGGTNLTLETVAAVGKQYGSKPDWVSYLVRSNGKWVHSTIYTVPAHSVVHVTLYEFDSPTGLRNPSSPRSGALSADTITINGKTVSSVGPEEPAHTFAIPELGVFVPLPGVNEEAKNFCEEGPCEPATQEHNTITFSFRTGKKGRYRWQCFVPCGAGFLNGNGGPMQTLGYMDGFIDVV